MAKRKLTEMAQMNLRLPEALRRRVEAEAKKYGRSLNRELVRRVEASFDQQEIEAIIRWTAQEAANAAVAQMMHHVQMSDEEKAKIDEAAKQADAEMMRHMKKGRSENG